MTRFVVKNGHQRDMHYNEIRVCAQNIDIIRGSIVNIQLEGLCDHLKRKIIIALSSYYFFASQLHFCNLK